jgi:hypothetical protein
MAGRPPGSQNKDKPFRDALRIEQALLNSDDPLPDVRRGSLRYIARQMLQRACDELADVKEIADRLDGKVPQGIGGDDELGKIRVDVIRRIIVKPGHSDGGGVPPAAVPSSV